MQTLIHMMVSLCLRFELLVHFSGPQCLLSGSLLSQRSGTWGECCVDYAQTKQTWPL